MDELRRKKKKDNSYQSPALARQCYYIPQPLYLFFVQTLRFAELFPGISIPLNSFLCNSMNVTCEKENKCKCSFFSP